MKKIKIIKIIKQMLKKIKLINKIFQTNFINNSLINKKIILESKK